MKITKESKLYNWIAKKLSFPAGKVHGQFFNAPADRPVPVRPLHKHLVERIETDYIRREYNSRLARYLCFNLVPAVFLLALIGAVIRMYIK